MSILNYSSHPDLLAALALWKEEGRCPFWLQDRLLDWGLEEAADCARWCYVTERGEWRDSKRNHVYPDSDPYPLNQDCYQWWRKYKYYDCIPSKVFSRIYPDCPTRQEYGGEVKTFNDCILALLDNWEVGAEKEMEAVT